MEPTLSELRLAEIISNHMGSCPYDLYDHQPTDCENVCGGPGRGLNGDFRLCWVEFATQTKEKAMPIFKDGSYTVHENVFQPMEEDANTKPSAILPEKQNEIPMIINELWGRVGRLEEVSAMLLDKLKPISINSDEPKASLALNSCKTELGISLQSIVNKLSALADKLADKIQAIEL